MIKSMAVIFVAPFLVTSVTAIADVSINSNDGSSLFFSGKLTGENIDNNAWGKLYYISESKKVELSLQDRYYLENDAGSISKKSPTGNYILFYSVSGEMVSLGDGTEKYVDRAYCSVIDMRNGCIVSDWDGEACGYDWVKSKDVLASSEDKGAEVFDFKVMRPSINIKSTPQVIANKSSLENMLRCDPLNKTNVDIYQLFLKANKEYSSTIKESMLDYLRSLSEKEVKNKSMLFSNSNENSQSKAYLIAGDKVRVIQASADGRWVNIGYINKKNNPLIAWIEAVNLR
ncbi:hypothetical protein [Aeromonas dhakensis]|uniref:hypothetical protein n=1 Tax=Aeromonas dhakensis TaxID=196024 RepID=UPI0018A7AC23|nr:hypothetical protein [Aeromonas dhakensis]MBF8450802.1 hypothetical protein [Aeromonas dhakensis]MBW3731634.1 hypothetical protein [Aeromonas dhakensis]QSR56249.1 hypothetical protein GO601_12905 [Aeromonas dhakensis]HEB4979112.1 hypothetical protein [Aeromonas dhakensis]